MSATMTLKHKVARRSASAINLIQHSLLILGLAFALGLINLIPGGAQPIDLFKAALPELLSDAEADDGIVANATPTPANAATHRSRSGSRDNSKKLRGRPVDARTFRASRSMPDGDMPGLT